MKPVVYTFVGTAILLGAIFLVFFRDDSPQARKADPACFLMKSIHFTQKRMFPNIVMQIHGFL